MHLAFNRLKEIGGGIVLTEQGQVIHELPLKLKGVMSNKEVPELIKEENELKKLLRERGENREACEVQCHCSHW